VKVFISDTIQCLSPKKKHLKISEIQPLSPIPFLAQQNLDDTIPTDIPSATTDREVEYFDESDDEEEDPTPIEEIEDPEGIPWTGDNGEAEFQAFNQKRRGTYMFVPSVESVQDSPI
jgi:hypothetical protein